MINIDFLIKDLELVRKQSPLIHNITNLVVMNNTANALLAIGASPVMAHALDEVADMTKIASALVLNIGTLDVELIKAMERSGKMANQMNIPIIFDPVGAGATPFRDKCCKRLINECKPTIIRGNASEILALQNTQVQTKGVDSTDASVDALDAAKKLAKEIKSTVVISGDIDFITDGEKVAKVKNGNPMMEKVTGMGCTSTAIIACFATINPNPFLASLHGMAVMGIAGEIAAENSKGTGSLQLNFLDELYQLTSTTLKKHIKL
ncbi:MAG: hydroxyethylthiazole kinase [Bacteroidaceae bacterium]